MGDAWLSGTWSWEGELSVVEVVGIVVYQGCGVVKGRVTSGVELSGGRVSYQWLKLWA